VDEPAAVTAAAWHHNEVWIADEAGMLRRFNTQTGQWTVSQWAGSQWTGGGYITALLSDGDALYAGTSIGAEIRLDPPENEMPYNWRRWIGALASGAHGTLYAADRSYYDLEKSVYREGEGIVTYGAPNPFTATDASRQVNALVYDGSTLWAGTDYAGLLRCDPAKGTCATLNTFNSNIPDNTVRDVKLAPDGTPWIAYPGGAARVRDDMFGAISLGGGLSPSGVRSLAFAPDGTFWAAGEYFVAWVDRAGHVTTYSAFDHPLFLDDFKAVVIDKQGHPWFAGANHLITFDGQTWTFFSHTGGAMPFTPGDPPLADVPQFPDPLADYAGWLKTWTRPADDNGLCMHYLQSPTGDAFETRQQIARLTQLRARWVLVNYLDHAQLAQLAPLFAQAGITVIWRPYVSPLAVYPDWAKDVRFLRSLGLPPYMQIYNEPNLEQGPESGTPGQAQATYQQNLVGAVRAVYDAGGYVGLQHIDPDWLRASLRALKAANLNNTFNRLFFVPHPYGFNHPPSYDADLYGVLGFRVMAQVFREEIGFVPMMIAGEGGWRPGEAQDSNFPAVSETLHRDYHLAVFQWFQTGVLSNGEPLPDYLFAFCPWLLSDPFDPAAWFDSRSGDRTLTIQAVEGLPPFVRQFKNLPR
jgi:hypothetical protein